MLKIDAGSSPSPYCDGLTRRSFVQLGVAGMASRLDFPDVGAGDRGGGCIL